LRLLVDEPPICNNRLVRPSIGVAIMASDRQDQHDGMKAGKAAPTWKRLAAAAASMLRRAARFVFRNYNDLFTKLPWAVVIVIIMAILIRGLTERVTIIQPLSVPRALADSGYTPEVAGGRLRDALAEFIEAAKSHMHSPEIAMPGELPNIAVPSVGVSLDAIMSSVRTLLGITRSRTITGEFTIAGGRLWLRLRIDGRELYTSGEGVDPERPDDLLKAAAPAVLGEIKPYIVASSLASSDPAQALDTIDLIISRYPESDDNVIWAFNLRGYIYYRQKDYALAIAALNKAIRLDGRIAAFHVNLGSVFDDQGDHDKAIAEYRRAIKDDPRSAVAHNNLGVTLRNIGKSDQAAAEHREAIRLDPGNSGFHNNLCAALLDAGERDEAIAQCRKAVKLDPKNVPALNNLGFVLKESGKIDEAIATYRQAIKIDPSYVLAHNNLGDALLAKGMTEDAVAEFQAALKINPGDGYAAARLQDLGAKDLGIDDMGLIGRGLKLLDR
jgi:tetratricopeptide (TPR) repeat protein